MALRDFWISVRAASGMMLPKAAVDSPRLDQDRIENLLRGATFWLTPGAVNGYDREELTFLTDVELKRIDEGVREFRDVAKTVPQSGPASDDQISRGMKGFGKILEVIRPDKYPDFDAFVIGKKIEALTSDEMPGWVREMVFETDYDSSGAPALWIWVEVEDYAIGSASFYDDFTTVSEILRRAVEQTAPDRWPYIRLRSVSEQRPEDARRHKARSKKR